jgi:hypothetical protein
MAGDRSPGRRKRTLVEPICARRFGALDSSGDLGVTGELT